MKCSRAALSLVFAAVVGVMPAAKPINCNPAMAADIGLVPPAEAISESMTAEGMTLENMANYWCDTHLLAQADYGYLDAADSPNPDGISEFDFVKCECGYCEYCLLRQKRLEAEQTDAEILTEETVETSLADESSDEESAQSATEEFAEQSSEEFQQDHFPYRYGYGTEDFDYSYYENGKYGEVSREQRTAEQAADNSSDSSGDASQEDEVDNADQNDQPTRDEAATDQQNYEDYYAYEYVYEEEGYYDPYAGECTADEDIQYEGAEEIAREGFHIYEVGNRPRGPGDHLEDENAEDQPGWQYELDEYERVPLEEYVARDQSHREEHQEEPPYERQFENYYQEHILGGGLYDDGYGYTAYNDEEQETTAEPAAEELTQDVQDFYHDRHGDDYADDVPGKTYWTSVWAYGELQPVQISGRAADDREAIEEEVIEEIAEQLAREITDEYVESMIEAEYSDKEKYDEYYHDEYNRENEDYYVDYGTEYGDYDNWSYDSPEQVYSPDAAEAYASSEEASAEDDSQDAYVYEEGVYRGEYGDEKYWSYLQWEHAYTGVANDTDDVDATDDTSAETENVSEENAEDDAKDDAEDESSSWQYESEYDESRYDHGRYGDEHEHYSHYDTEHSVPREDSYWSQDDLYGNGVNYTGEDTEANSLDEANIYRREFDYGYSENSYTDLREEDENGPPYNDPTDDSADQGFDYELEMHEDHEYFQTPERDASERVYRDDVSDQHEAEAPQDTLDKSAGVPWGALLSEAANVNAAGAVAGVFVSFGGQTLLQLDDVLRGLSQRVKEFGGIFPEIPSSENRAADRLGDDSVRL